MSELQFPSNLFAIAIQMVKLAFWIWLLATFLSAIWPEGNDLPLPEKGCVSLEEAKTIMKEHNYYGPNPEED